MTAPTTRPRPDSFVIPTTICFRAADGSTPAGPSPRRRKAYEEVLLEWVDLRSQGLTYREIGERYGYSHERVRQLIGHVPYVRRPPESVKLARRITSWLEGQGVVPLPELLEAFDLTETQYHELVRVHRDVPRHLVIRGERDRRNQYSDEDILAALREVWTRPGLDLGPTFSHEDYSRHRTPGQPSVALVNNRFRGWRAACLAADIPAGKPPRSTYERDYDPAQLLAGVRRYLRHAERLGERPTYLGYERFQKGDPTLACGSTVRNRLREVGIETWPRIVTAAQHHVLAA